MQCHCDIQSGGHPPLFLKWFIVHDRSLHADYVESPFKENDLIRLRSSFFKMLGIAMI